LQTFNQIDSNIQFELELPDKNKSLNILDLNICINNNSVKFKFYKKKARKNIFVNFNSNLPRPTLMNICLNELSRVLNKYESNDNIDEALQTFRQLLKDNNYPQNFIEKVIYKYTKMSRTDKKNKNTRKHFYLDLPYIDDNLNNYIKNVYKKYNIPVRIYHRNKSLRNILANNKSKTCTLNNCTIKNDKLCTKRNCVYEITCKCGDYYIGSTTRELHTRIKEHNTKTSSVYKHLKICKNKFEDLNIKIISIHKDLVNTRIHEGMIIHKSKYNKPNIINKKTELNDFQNILHY